MSEWLSLSLQITNVGDDVEEMEHLYSISGNVNWYSHEGKKQEKKENINLKRYRQPNVHDSAITIGKT